MSDLIGKFDDLGYDLLDLDSIIYLSNGPGTDPKPECSKTCLSCMLSCSVGGQSGGPGA